MKYCFKIVQIDCFPILLPFLLLLNQCKQDWESLPSLAPDCICQADPTPLSPVLYLTSPFRKLASW